LSQPITKSALSETQRRLVELLQTVRFGRIERLHVRDGQPTFDPAPRVVRKLKMGHENGPRPETTLQDFGLKHQTIEMLQAIADLGDGEVLSIEVQHGLPFAVEIEFKETSTGAQSHA